MANGSCSASTTWLSVSRSVTLPSPRMPMMKTAGRIASVRVMSRRTHGLMRQCMKPSITTCPASVPVMVLLWPLASSATANSVLASGGPQQRRQRQIRDANPVAVGAEVHHLPAGHRHAFFAEEHHRRQHQDRRIDEEGDGKRHRSSRWC